LPFHCPQVAKCIVWKKKIKPNVQQLMYVNMTRAQWINIATEAAERCIWIW
jgi:hypothetical protein